MCGVVNFTAFAFANSNLSNQIQNYCKASLVCMPAAAYAHVFLWFAGWPLKKGQ